MVGIFDSSAFFLSFLRLISFRLYLSLLSSSAMMFIGLPSGLISSKTVSISGYLFLSSE